MDWWYKFQRMEKAMSAGTKEQAILELRQFIDEIESDRYDLISIQSQTPYKIEL